MVHDLLVRAVACESRRDWYGALEHLREAHRQDPSRGPLVAAIARVLLRLGRVEEAGALLQQELAANPASIPARLALAALLERQGDDAGAHQAYQAVLKSCPDHLGAKLVSAAQSAANSFPPLLFVLGMHRSVTSAVAGALCQLGCRPPASMPPADANNPTGYWEPLAIVKLHTALLEQSQSSWDDPFLSADLWAPQRLAEGLSSLENALQSEFPSRQRPTQWCLIKDPRQCRLQPLWNHLIKHHHIQAAAVLVNRHPLSVVQSLRRREHLPANRALLLWIQHQLDAERHTRHLPRWRVTYEDFLQRPGHSLQGPMGLLDATGASSSRTRPHQALVRPDLDHSAGGPSLPERDTDPSLVSLAQEIYQVLRSAPEAAMRERLDCLRGELERHLSLLRSQLGRMTTLQLFWQRHGEAGFAEADSLRSSIPVGRGTTIHTLALPDGIGPICALRLDPAETPCLVTIQQLSLIDGSGQPLWQWMWSRDSGVAPENLPFQAANGETRLLTKGGEEAPGVSVLCEGHDPALLLGLPGEALRGINSGSRLTIEASWELLSSDLSHLLASLPASP